MYFFSFVYVFHNFSVVLYSLSYFEITLSCFSKQNCFVWEIQKMVLNQSVFSKRNRTHEAQLVCQSVLDFHRGLFISRGWRNSLKGYVFASGGKATYPGARGKGPWRLTAVSSLTASDFEVHVLLKLWPTDIAEYTCISGPKWWKRTQGKVSRALTDLPLSHSSQGSQWMNCRV